ncbi:hypothetical protein [Bradyrhizobium sp. ERR14]|uniref:hypothetical protein n=1 Tax=Bradyrhizobium sp. ERR14 TaxID=2663837 RepID=UPI00161073FC|nr:hypothetical protein [Bradyrhizobium sp. ERR14]MBB4395095.1 hypothetical protein [Bradyrhizobium sp. ERR14]
MRWVVAGAIFYFGIAVAIAEKWIAKGSLSPGLFSYTEGVPKTSRLDIGIFIRPGSEKEATDYYQRIGGVLGFDFLNSTLDILVSHLGYTEPQVVGGKIVFKGLTATNLEELPSFALMPRNFAEFNNLADAVADPASFRALLSLQDFQNDAILVSRFFAPKIATYYNPANAGDPFAPIDPDNIVPGWRKLVRVTPRSGSQAQRDGKIAHVYILFNFKEADPNADPFLGKESGNNQIIIVPKDSSAGDRVFFGVYREKSRGYPIGLFLKADFDLPGHVGIGTGAKDSEYFVPRACAECHGHSATDSKGTVLQGQPVDPNGQATEDFTIGIYRFAKPNYLDTDQWYDWKDFDYRGVSGSLNDVVFDGGRDVSSSAYVRAFDVMRKLNTNIERESVAAEADPNVPTFQTLGVRKWLELHQLSDARKPYSVRSIGAVSWDATKPDEMKLLRLLDNHCFRCHSSLRYNVFDKQAVANRKELIIRFLNIQLQDNGTPLPGNFMPQGRVLSSNEKTEIEQLLTKVFP